MKHWVELLVTLAPLLVGIAIGFFLAWSCYEKRK